ncbi:hypothetical protein J6590_071191 [Homalodisca vitripennis]|nr:hypothetical protein J6590_071191 [Homalodisca vitripennis]
MQSLFHFRLKHPHGNNAFIVSRATSRCYRGGKCDIIASEQTCMDTRNEGSREINQPPTNNGGPSVISYGNKHIDVAEMGRYRAPIIGSVEKTINYLTRPRVNIYDNTHARLSQWNLHSRFNITYVNLILHLDNGMAMDWTMDLALYRLQVLCLSYSCCFITNVFGLI